MNELLSGKFNPTEMAQGTTSGIAAMAGHAGGIQVRRASTVAAETNPVALASPKGMVHVAKHHQGNGAMATDLLNRQGQVLVAPIHGWRFPVAAAGGRGLTTKPRWSTVAQQHQGCLWIGSHRRRTDPIDGFLQGDRPKSRQGGLGKMEPPPQP